MIDDSMETDDQCPRAAKRPRLLENEINEIEVNYDAMISGSGEHFFSDILEMESDLNGWSARQYGYGTTLEPIYANAMNETGITQPVPIPSFSESLKPIANSADLPTEELDILPETSKDHNIKKNEVVCFGMISGITATYELKGRYEVSSSFSIRVDSPSRFSSKKDDAVKGRIQAEHCDMIEGLIEDCSINLQATCIPDQTQTPKKQGRNCLVVPCTLDIMLYGPFELFDEIGQWFQDYEVYLQDPDKCQLDTRYCNPHRMSSDNFGECPLVSEVVSRALVLSPTEIPEPPDYLDILSSQVELEETPQPSIICSSLKRHQKQALTFMLNREEGWGFKYEHADIWEVVETRRGRMFHNTITRAAQPEEPPQFYGGIIADPMGLGKTLTMIALVATDIEAEKTEDASLQSIHTEIRDAEATLVIIPPPLIGSWEEQLRDHVIDGSLLCRRHHGKNKLSDEEELGSVNLVLTTYHTVTAEWKADKGSHKSPLFSVCWKRIILDEAHFIRNSNSRMARAVCALEARSRWAVTGTPIQNRLGDLASLLKFIRAHPYTETKRFETDISRLWKSGEDEEAVKRLKRLSACLLLRRGKSTINLPPRQDVVYKIQFTPAERAVYEHIRQQTIAKIDEALGNDTNSTRSGVYVNVLQQIESMRLFTNLGLFYEARHKKPSQPSSEGEEWSKIAQRTFNSEREISVITCLQCSSTLGLTETLLEDTRSSAGTAQYTSCLRYVCGDCLDKLSHMGQDISCGHVPSCQTALVSTSGIELEEIDSLDTPPLRISPTTLPSKIKALIDDIKATSGDVKCTVFSTWRLTLDLIKAGLDHESIQSIRFDGKVPQKDRQTVVKTFESDPSIRVMLLTLSCGAVGLTLTAASRAYLMEPHWNPTLEEQALARIHRLGQTRDVTTVRLCVRDSFDEQVMKMQESKKQLAGVLLSHHDNGYTENDVGALQVTVLFVIEPSDESVLPIEQDIYRPVAVWDDEMWKSVKKCNANGKPDRRSVTKVDKWCGVVVCCLVLITS